jgi:hypothetical protein
VDLDSLNPTPDTDPDTVFIIDPDPDPGFHDPHEGKYSWKLVF